MKAKIKDVKTYETETLEIYKTKFEFAKNENGKWETALLGYKVGAAGEQDTAEEAKEAIREKLDGIILDVIHIIAARIAENIESIKSENNKN